MTDFSDNYGGRFMTATDIEKPFKGIVERVEEAEMTDTGRKKAVVFFEGYEKGVVLNATRFHFMCDMAKSRDSDDWLGVAVGVRRGKTSFAGKRVDCIEFGALPKSAEQKKAEVRDELDDDLPGDWGTVA